MQVRKSILILVIIAACLGSYFNTLFADFVCDDNIFITPNPYMKSFQFLPRFFVDDFGHIGVQRITSSYYRPLLAASYMFDYTIWGNNPFGFHLTNLLFHIFSCILIFALIELLFHNRLIAFISTLLFSVHPIHTEAVSFISGRVDVIPPAFFLLSLVLFIQYAYRNNRFFYALSLASFAIAILTKEMALTLPLVVLCIDYVCISKLDFKNVLKNFFRFHMGFFIILGVYLIIRFYVVGGLFIKEVPQAGINFVPGTNPFWRLFTVIKILSFHIRLLFFPYNLHIYHKFPPSNSLFEPIVLLGTVILLLLVYTAIKNIKRYPVLSFSILWFFITVLPVSNIFPRGNIFAERFLYIPSVGFCIGIGFFFSWLLKKNIKTSFLNWKKSITILFILLIVAFGRVTYERNKVWANDFNLWSDTVNKSPQSSIAHLNLGVEYYKLNLLDRALEENRIALELPYHLDSVSRSIAFSAIAQIYFEKGLVDEAIEVFKLAIEINPDSVVAYQALSSVYGIIGQYNESIKAALIALEKNPYLESARYNLALSYRNIGLMDEAIQTYEEFLKNNPNHIDAHVAVGYLYYEKGDYQKAKEHWFRTLKISKDYQPAKDALKLLEN